MARTVGTSTLKEQLNEAEAYLETLQADRTAIGRELEEEAKLFLETPGTLEQENRFNLIYQLVRFHVSYSQTQVIAEVRLMSLYLQ